MISRESRCLSDVYMKAHNYVNSVVAELVRMGA
jgi:hypothetical protein